jgi:predicted membrane-bound spermidine synthase
MDTLLQPHYGGRMTPSLEKKLVLATAFGEGLSVLVIEIAGARALAPYYGSSLKVWTAQITATLLFLALGYGAGGKFSRRPGAWKLGATLWAAGLWLALYPFMRNAVLSGTAASAGVALGSFLAAALLFGLPLLCLGALSPLLISRLDAIDKGAGSSAGALFFTNTLGGLAGGWLTALVLIPHIPLRLALAGTGIFLALMGSFWSLVLRKGKGGAAAAAPLTALVLMLIAPRPSASLSLNRMPTTVLVRQESGVGLIQVLDIGPYGRTLLLDGVTQGGMSKETGTSVYEFTEYLNYLSYRYHPQAKSALLLGLGTGLLAKQLVKRGLSVSVAEIEPAMEGVARGWFGLPAEVVVHAEDARAWLNRTHETYDLVFLDAFAGENAPWYLSTREGLAQIKRALNPGGRLLINSVTRENGSEGLDRLEAGLMEAFGEGLVFTEAPQQRDKSDMINATLVAGAGLKAGTGKFPSTVVKRLEPKLAELAGHVRAAKAGAGIMTDELCDLDYAESELRLEWRKLVFQALGPSVLAD